MGFFVLRCQGHTLCVWNLWIGDWRSKLAVRTLALTAAVLTSVVTSQGCVSDTKRPWNGGFLTRSLIRCPPGGNGASECVQRGWKTVLARKAAPESLAAVCVVSCFPPTHSESGRCPPLLCPPLLCPPLLRLSSSRLFFPSPSFPRHLLLTHTHLHTLCLSILLSSGALFFCQ